MNETEKDSFHNTDAPEGIKEEEFSFQPRFSVRKRVMIYYWVLTFVVAWISFSIYNNHSQEKKRLEKISKFHGGLLTLYKQLASDAAAFPPALQAVSSTDTDSASQAFDDVQKNFEKTLDAVQQRIASPAAVPEPVDMVRKYSVILYDSSVRQENMPDVKKRGELLQRTKDAYKNISAMKEEAESILSNETEIRKTKSALIEKPLPAKMLQEKLQAIANLESEASSLRNEMYNKSLDAVTVLQNKVKDMETFEGTIIAFEQRTVNWHSAWLFVIAGLMAVGALLIVWIAGRYTDKNFVAPIISLAKSAREIAGGNLEHEADVKTGDEYEVLAQAFNTMKNKLKRIISNQQVQINKLLKVTSSAAQGNLTQFSDIQTQDDFGKLSSSLNMMIENLRAIVSSVENAIKQLIRASQDISSSAQTQSTEVSDQSVQITEIASSFHELSATAKSIADSAKKVSETSTKAAEAAQSGEMAAAKSIDAMKNINRTFETTAKKISGLQERSKNIGKVVTTIADLAEQINRLALNATIEAARAGEHGKGFAVVADEVRKLAEKSSGFTEEIKTIITGVREETQSAVMAMEQGTKTMNEGVKLVTLAGEALKEITQLVEDVETHSREILYSTKQQHEGSEQVSTAVSSVSQTMRDIEFQARQTSSAAQSLVGLAKSLETNIKDIET